LSDEKKEKRGSDEKMDTSFDLKNIYIVSNFGICEFSKGSI
jgi:hypothetical protein